MSERELTVCHVEVGGGSFGTGFLLGPSVVMTNYHVVKDVIKNPALCTHVKLRFDYKTYAEITTLNEGQVFRLFGDANSLLDHSPVDDLDYALLNVAGKPGKAPVGGQQGAPARGWLKPQLYAFEAGEPIIIIQHPQAAPLKITIGSVTSIKPDQNRIHYSANTLPGSSGSPCFDSDWNLVALHHIGDPSGNEGLIFATILARLEQNNLLQWLDESKPS